MSPEQARVDAGAEVVRLAKELLAIPDPALGAHRSKYLDTKAQLRMALEAYELVAK